MTEDVVSSITGPTLQAENSHIPFNPDSLLLTLSDTIILLTSVHDSRSMSEASTVRIVRTSVHGNVPTVFEREELAC